jgi:transglycosylase-like protein
MTMLRGRSPNAALIVLAALAVAAAAVLAIPAGARRTLARGITTASVHRGLTARWAALDVRFPAHVVISQLRLTDAERGSMVFRAESLAVSIDPLSVLMLHPRASRIELAHAFARRARGRAADPDTLAPAEEAQHRDHSEKVRRTMEAVIKALLVPARRLPQVELRDVEVASEAAGEDAGAAVRLEWLDLAPGRDGVTLAGAGRLVAERDVPFSFRGHYGDDDRLQGGARIGIYDEAFGAYAPLGIAFEGRLIQDRHAGTVELQGPMRIQVGQVPVLLTAALATRGPHIDVSIRCDSLTPERVIASLPRPLLGPLPLAGARGSWDYRLGFRLDVSQPDSVDFHADVIPHDLELDPERCRLNLLTLDQPFTATIHLPHGRTATRELSDANPHYRPLDAIDSTLAHAVLTNEDGAFFRHGGFNAEAVKGAIADNIRAGAYRRGAGTITMQLARNLYLGHERTLSRKAQEVVLAWMLEHMTYVTKRRLLEIYLNVIEWGPGVHGADEAAHYYFGRDAGHLTVDQSLFLATVVPAPTQWRYRFDAAGRLRPFERAQMHFIGRAMIKKGWLSPPDLPPADSLRVLLAAPARSMLSPGDSLAPPTQPQHADTSGA